MKSAKKRVCKGLHISIKTTNLRESIPAKNSDTRPTSPVSAVHQLHINMKYKNNVIESDAVRQSKLRQIQLRPAELRESKFFRR